jgi:hypothetical protein
MLTLLFLPQRTLPKWLHCKFCHFDHEKRQRKTNSKKTSKVEALPRSDSRDASAFAPSSEEIQKGLPPPGLEEAFPRLPAMPCPRSTQPLPVYTTLPKELTWLDTWVPFANFGLGEPMPEIDVRRCGMGMPVKVALQGFNCEVKTLDPRIPAKKKVPNYTR